MKFIDLKLPSYIMDALCEQNFVEATEIQEKSLPEIFSGKDFIGKSQTGSGKTYAFGIPAVELVDGEDKSTQVLIVCPTRELAGQVCDELRKITKYKPGCRIVPIFGGSNMDRQIGELKKGARIVVGTPGRLMDHLRRRTLKLKNLKMLVLDEADEMLNMGFREDIEEILKTTNPNRQTVMFSATMPEPILAITKNYMKEPVLVDLSTTNKNLFIDQYFVSVGLKDKEAAIKELYKKTNPALSIIFCNTKKMVDNLVEKLKDDLKVLGLHGDMRQGERKRVMQQIKSGKVGGVLIATDVAARGIDINNVDIVFNYDIPYNSEYYTHRIGRTGRAGKRGEAYTIVNTRGQMAQIEEIQKISNNEISEYICSLSKSQKSVSTKFQKSVSAKVDKGDKKENKERTREGRKEESKKSSNKVFSKKGFEDVKEKRWGKYLDNKKEKTFDNKKVKDKKEKITNKDKDYSKSQKNVEKDFFKKEEKSKGRFSKNSFSQNKEGIKKERNFKTRQKDNFVKENKKEETKFASIKKQENKDFKLEDLNAERDIVFTNKRKFSSEKNTNFKKTKTSRFSKKSKESKNPSQKFSKKSKIR